MSENYNARPWHLLNQDKHPRASEAKEEERIKIEIRSNQKRHLHLMDYFKIYNMNKSSQSSRASNSSIATSKSLKKIPQQSIVNSQKATVDDIMINRV